MKQKIAQYLFIGIGTLVSVLLVSTYRTGTKVTSWEPRDLPAIFEEGVLRAVTEYNTVSYHIDGDTTMGFDYEVLHAFAKELKVELSITPEMSFEKQMDGLLSGAYDILATNLTVNTAYEDSLSFTLPLLTTQYVLVQRKEADTLSVRTPFDLANKQVHIVKDSPIVLRIKHLMEEIADTIYVKEVPIYGTEQLIAMVAGKDIDYLICDQDLAENALSQHEGIDASVAIGFSQLRAWGVNKKSAELLARFNDWFVDFRKTRTYKRLLQKYFDRV